MEAIADSIHYTIYDISEKNEIICACERSKATASTSVRTGRGIRIDRETSGRG